MKYRRQLLAIQRSYALGTSVLHADSHELDLVTNLSRRPGTAPKAISRKMRPEILCQSQTWKLSVEPGLDSFGAVKASRPEEANDVGAADDNHRMPVSSYLLIRLPVHV